MQFLKKLSRQNNGATAVEYAIIAAAIAVACVVGFQAVGTSINTKSTAITTSLN